MANTPKILGKVGLNVSTLKKDVDEAKKQIDRLSKEAKSLGKIFSSIKIKTNFEEVAEELRKLSNNLKNVTGDVERRYTKLYNVVSNGQKRVVETIKQRQKLGIISPEQAGSYLSAYEWTNMSNIKSNAEKVKALKDQLKINESELQVARNTNAETLVSKHIEDTKKELQELIGLNKGYIEEMHKAQSARENIRQKLEKSETAFKKKNTNQEVKEAKTTSNALLKISNDRFKTENMYRKMFVSIEQKERQQTLMAEKQLNAQRIKEDLERQKKTLMYRKMFDQIEKEDNRKKVQQAKQQKKEIDKILDTQYSGSARDRMKSLSNYAFDAALLYGGMQGVTAITNNVKSIEKESVELSRIMANASKFDIAQLRQNAFDVGKMTAQQVGDVQKIQNLWARTSDVIANNAEAMKKLTQVTAIGMNVGGFADAEEAVQLLNASLNQMGLEWTQAESVMDSWIKIADTSAVGSAKDLADSMMKVGSQAKLLGLGVHDVNAITAILANNMAKTGEDIGTALKTIFSYFTDENTIKILDKYGVQVKKNAKEYNNFIYIMEQLHTTYRKLEQDKNEVGIRELSDALGRVRRVDYVGNLMSNWGEYQQLVQTSLDSTGYAIEQNEKVMSTYEAQIGQLQVAFQELSWAIGESGLLEDLKGLVKGATSAIEWFNSLDKSVKTFILRIIELSTAYALLSKFSNLIAGKSVINLITQLTSQIIQNTIAYKANTAVVEMSASALGKLKLGIGGLLVVIPLVVAYVQGLKAHMAELKEKTDNAKEGIRKFKEMMSKKYLTESDIPSYEDRLTQLKEAQKKLAEFQADVANKKKNEFDLGGGVLGSGGHAEYMKAVEALKAYELELGILGTTANTIEQDMSDLNAKIEQNKDVNYVNAQKAIEMIENMQKQNRTIKEAIATYKVLHAQVQKTGIKTAEYNNVVDFLSKNFSQLKPEIDKNTGAIILDVKAMEEALGATGALTSAQMNSLEMYAQLNKACKENAITMATETVKATEIILKSVEARVLAHQAEQSELGYETRLYTERMKLLDRWKTKLAEAKGLLDALDKVKPYSERDFDTESLGEGDKDYKAKFDEYYDFNRQKLKLENEINMVQAKSNATQYGKVELIEEEIKLLKQEQQLLADINNAQRKEKENLKSKLLGHGFKFSGDTITNYDKLKSFTGDNAKDIEALVERYIDLVNGVIPEMSNKWWDIQGQIVNAENAKLNKIQEIENKIKDIIKQRYDDEKQRLDKSVRDYEDSINKKIEAINRQYDEESYKDNMADEQKTLSEIQSKINKLMFDDSKEAKSQLKELEKEKANQLKTINDMQKNKEKEDRIQELNDKVDSFRRETEVHKQELDEQYSNEKINIMARQALLDGYYKDLNGKIVTVKEEYISFENRLGSGFSALGEKIKNDFIKNLDDAMRLFRSFNELTKGSVGIGTNSITSNLTSNVPVSVPIPNMSGHAETASLGIQIENLVTINGNVDKNLLPQIQQSVEDSLRMVLDNAKKAGVVIPY